MKVKYIPLLILLSVIVSGCCKKKIYCNSGALDFAFTGYERAEARSFTLKKYPIDDYSGAAIDSAYYTYSGSRPDTGISDTLYLSEFTSSGSKLPIISGSDYILRFTRTGKQFLFRLVTEEEYYSELVRCNDNSTTCTKAVTGFDLNYNWTYGSFVYIEEGKY